MVGLRRTLFKIANIRKMSHNFHCFSFTSFFLFSGDRKCVSSLWLLLAVNFPWACHGSACLASKELTILHRDSLFKNVGIAKTVLGYRDSIFLKNKEWA